MATKSETVGSGGFAGNTRPPVGQMCLVMAGRADQEQGQVGIVTRQTACMVEIAVCPKDGARTVAHLKRPSSLIWLEPGLILVQETNGAVWIRHDPSSR